jgi:hypothetical protein
MSTKANRAIVRRYFEDAPYNPETCDQIFAPKIIWHTMNHSDHPEFISDPKLEKDAYSSHINQWGAWSEFIDEMLAEGDRVMVRWTFRGTHQASYLDIPPSFQPITFSGIYIFRIETGRIAEIWSLWDRLTEWQQLGILPDNSEILSQAKMRYLSTEE